MQLKKMSPTMAMLIVERDRITLSNINEVKYFIHNPSVNEGARIIFNNESMNKMFMWSSFNTKKNSSKSTGINVDTLDISINESSISINGKLFEADSFEKMPADMPAATQAFATCTVGELLPALSAASHALAKNDIRFYLTHPWINVPAGTDRLDVVGTDGHKLVYTTIQNRMYPSDEQWGFAVNRQVVPMLAALNMNDDAFVTLRCDDTNNNIVFSLNTGIMEIDVVVKIEHRSLPDYRRVVADSDACKNMLAVDAKQFMSAIKDLHTYTKGIDADTSAKYKVDVRVVDDNGAHDAGADISRIEITVGDTGVGKVVHAQEADVYATYDGERVFSASVELMVQMAKAAMTTKQEKLHIALGTGTMRISGSVHKCFLAGMR